MLQYVGYVTECTHAEWVGQPKPLLGHSCLFLSSAHSLGALPECKPQQRQEQERTRANRRVIGFVQDGLRRSKAICCFQLNLSGAAERNTSTDLGAAGQVEVDEIVAALPCGQVQKTFVCESVAVGQTQILKAQAVSVRCKK